MRTLLPIPSEDDAEFFYDPHGYADELMRYVKAVAAGPSGAGLIIGNYGFGKTHLLLHVARRATAEFAGSIVTYVNTPGSSFMNLYRAFMLKVLSNNELLGVLAEAPDGLLRNVTSLILGGGEEAEYARQWLLGEPTPQSFRVRRGLTSRVTDELALRLLLSAVDTLVGAGRGPVLILLDELEDIVTISQTKRLQYLSLLRSLLDNLPRKTLLLASSTPAGWDEIVGTYPALARRLSSFVIYLRPFTYEESLEFVRQFMKWRGLGLSMGDEVVKVIHEYSEGNPGEIVRIISLIYTSLNGKADPDSVKELLSRYV